ncbi:MAG TPA: FAD-binding oxidoreductase, partial [Casimicrobiaceae bacterium]
ANRQVVRLCIGRSFIESLRRHGCARFMPLSEPKVNERLIEENARGFAKLLPHLANLGIAKAWAGRIDATPDLIPMIGSVPSVRRYYVAAGFNGHGLALAPAVGQAVAELIVDGRSSIDLHALRVERYAEGDFERAGSAL